MVAKATIFPDEDFRRFGLARWEVTLVTSRMAQMLFN